MNLFEDLVEELKDDNLLEVTIIDSVQEDEPDQFLRNEPPAENSTDVDGGAVTIENPDDKDDQFAGDRSESVENETSEIRGEFSEVDSSPILNDDANESAFDSVPAVDQIPEERVDQIPEEREVQGARNAEAGMEDDLDAGIVNELEDVGDVELVKSEPAEEPFVKEEYYRRRAMDLVNGLKMVEHVISGVEREQMKLVPETFDTAQVKKSLREFLEIADEVKSPDHSRFEFAFMQETEKWTIALAKRDCNVSVGHLRRYAETTKPSLSSQALISLARFYRNAPFTEDVRGKFDLVVTKLFTEDIEDQKRNLAFKPEELSQHIQELYADWSSVPLYSTEEEDTELLLAAIKFEDFMQEAENAKGFDELIKKDFFRRLKAFKEKTSENFFAPMLVAAAINCNVVIGNRYLDLLEKDKNDGKNLGEKYGEVHDKSISDATSKTVHLLEVLREKGALKEPKKDAKSMRAGSKGSRTNISDENNQGLFVASKWLVIATLITIILACLYFFVSSSSSAENSNSVVSKDVKVVNLENSSLKEYVVSARIADGTLFAVTDASWGDLTFIEKQEVVDKFLRTGLDKDFSKVHFVNNEGGSVAFGSEDGVNIVE